MRLTQILLRQHIGKHIKKHWRVQGKKIPRESSALQSLKDKNIPIYEPNEILEETRTFEKVDVIGIIPKQIAFDSTHPNWHSRVCHTYKDENVLLEGLNQAKCLTRTVELQQGLPDKIIIKNSSKELDSRVKKIIYNSHLFDSEQVKLPKLKDPERPAWNFPRLLGISENRRNVLMVAKLLQLIESLSGPQLTKQRFVLNDLQFAFPFEKSGDLIQFLIKGDTLITSDKPLQPITQDAGQDVQLPNLYPIKDTVTLNMENIYEMKNVYPVQKAISKHHPHTVFIHYNATEVKNIYEEEVTDDQILGRSLLKTFTVAATYAKEQFGEDVKVLPKPVTMQAVQSDGKFFHFGVLQLNTLDLDSEDGPKNIWYQTDKMSLFESCSYVSGKPTLVGYNNDVIKHLLALYDNV